MNMAGVPVCFTCLKNAPLGCAYMEKPPEQQCFSGGFEACFPPHFIAALTVFVGIGSFSFTARALFGLKGHVACLSAPFRSCAAEAKALAPSSPLATPCAPVVQCRELSVSYHERRYPRAVRLEILRNPLSSSRHRRFSAALSYALRKAVLGKELSRRSGSYPRTQRAEPADHSRRSDSLCTGVS